MSDNLTPLEFVQEWRRKCALFASQSNDELASVLTRAFEVMIAVLKPNYNYDNIERLLASLQHENTLSMQYDAGATDIRAMTYGIAQSLHTTLADILLFRQRNADEVRIEEVVNDGEVDASKPEGSLAVSNNSLPIITVDASDFDDIAGEVVINQSMPVLDMTLNARNLTQRDESAVHCDATQSVPDEEEEEEVEVKPVIVKRKRGRPRKYPVEDANQSKHTLCAFDFEPTRVEKLSKADIEKNTVDFKKFDDKRVKQEEDEEDEMPAGRKKVKKEVDDDYIVENGKRKEPLEGYVQGTDCFVCKKTLKRNLRGYTGHLCKVHRITLKNSGYMLVCECGLKFDTSYKARDHINECDKLNFTAQRVDEDEGEE